MKKFYLLLVAVFFYAATYSQTIVLSGQCLSGSITLTFVGNENGKPAYVGSGTVMATPGVALSVSWIGAPDNVWVISFDGQPYYSNPCNTSIPPGTSPNICPWSFVSGNPACTGTPLVVTGDVVLPVTFTQFIASSSATSVLLAWKTAQESNNRGFTIERSADGQHWTDLGFVAGTINASTISAYQYIDNLPLTGINFYRLRQEDLDGRVTYSDVVTATFRGKKFFAISNNPGNGIYKLTIQPGAGITELSVTDASGKTILLEKSGIANPVIDISRQAPGIYWLRVKKGNELETVKLIKL